MTLVLINYIIQKLSFNPQCRIIDYWTDNKFGGLLSNSRRYRPSDSNIHVYIDIQFIQPIVRHLFAVYCCWECSHISLCDNKSANHWIMFFMFEKLTFFLYIYVPHLFLLICVKLHRKKIDNNNTLTHICLLPFLQLASYNVT